MHFTSRAAAEAAAALEEVEHMDGKVQVTMARPPAREMEMVSERSLNARPDEG